MAYNQLLDNAAGTFAGATTLVGSNTGQDSFNLFVDGSAPPAHTITIDNWQSNDILFITDLSTAGGGLNAAAATIVPIEKEFVTNIGTTENVSGPKASDAERIFEGNFGSRRQRHDTRGGPVNQLCTVEDANGSTACAGDLGQALAKGAVAAIEVHGTFQYLAELGRGAHPVSLRSWAAATATAPTTTRNQVRRSASRYWIAR